MVVVANLSSILLALQAKLLANKLVAESLPVVLRISYMMSIIVTSSATELSSHLASLQRLQLLCQSVNEYHNLLAQACRRSWLTMSLCQHRYILPLVSILLQLSDKFLNLWNEDIFQSLLYRQRYAGVVDILRSKSKVYELLISFEIANLVKLFLNKILHGLNVVVCNLFDILHTLCAILIKIAVNVAQAFEQALVKRSQLWQWQFAERDEIFYFHADTIAY
ncbi:glutathione s-transferase protein [Prevotella sp. CAG:1092]|nr:glutathione s-transferase protein [Prevotella sp. CAG:1092]